MAKHKEHPVTCAMCGLAFTTLGNSTKYCPECGKAVRAVQRKESYHRLSNGIRRNNRPDMDDDVHTCDSPEKVAMCLSCTKPNCTGACEMVDKHIKGTYKKSSINHEEFLALYNQKATDQEIADKLGFSRNAVTIYRNKCGLASWRYKRGKASC